MSWVHLMYFPNPIKHHFVHESVVEIVERDVEERHGHLPEKKTPRDQLKVDPGGMICIRNEPKTHSFNGATVAVQPEHILGGAAVWTRHRFLDETLPDGERVVKVYLSDLDVAVVPESMYHDIGAWLALSKAEGHIARAELAEALSGIPGLIVTPPPSEGDA